MDQIANALRERILVVHSTRFERAVTADTLARMGYATIEVDNAARALELIQFESPDLILLDSAVPDLNGLEVCRRLKSDPFTNHIPILVFTDDSSVPARVNTLRAGADAVVCKPFSPEELVAEVEVLLRRSFHFDPLTKLPAAPYMHYQIDARLAQNQPTAILYADIDHFHSYNQAYGHSAGDRALIETARLLVDCLPTGPTLVGHLGADDFLAVIAPESAETFAQTIVGRFRELHQTLYKEADLKRGSVFLENRRGDIIGYPLVTLSAAIACNDRRTLTSYVQASEILAEVMGYVKAQGGNRWLRDRRAR